MISDDVVWILEKVKDSDRVNGRVELLKEVYSRGRCYD